MTRRGRLPEEELDEAVAGLKPFQQRTVRTVVSRMFDRDSPQRRFLVADEVGLGKTKIARAIVAETIRRLWDDPNVDRIDIVYICSNHQIARQNVEDLRVVGGAADNIADRITMLPAVLSGLATAAVNVVAFTPDTSLRFGQARGRSAERAMLHHLLSQPDVLGERVMSRKGARRLLSLGAKQFDYDLVWAQTKPISSEVASGFYRMLNQHDLVEDFMRLSDGRARADSHEQQQLIGRLRRALAESCIELLTPDLIILDEFQRFIGILDGEQEDGQLAQLLFTQTTARVLLLSATPYRMLSTADDGESHYDGFERTIDFLLDKEKRTGEAALRPALTELRRGVLGHRDPIRLAEARDRVQGILRSVMVRTERLAATQERDGMLRANNADSCDVSSDDVRAFIGTDHVARAIGTVPSVVEYWKSAPYLFNFMDEYKIKKEIDSRLGDEAVSATLTGPHMLDWNSIDAYDHVKPLNGRLRWLISSLKDQRAFDRLWVPPSLPQTELADAYADAGRFTKRLIFSGWTVVPKVVAAMTSYEYERRHHRPRQRYEGTRFSGRLVLPKDNERWTNLALLLPTRRLADLGDPVAFARRTGRPLPIPLSELRAEIARQLEVDLEPWLSSAISTGPVSTRWYALAQYALDARLAALKTTDWAGDDTDPAGLTRHLNQMTELLDDPTEEWGRPPEDLISVLTDLAVAGPGVCLLRGLGRVRSRFGWASDDAELQRYAARCVWAFRSLLNSAEADQLINSSSADDEDFWRSVLGHCAAGGLGSVIDEWLHLLPEQLRLRPSSEAPLDTLVKAAVGVFRLTDGQVGVDDYGSSGTEATRHHMRTHFAMRFGQARGATAEGENPVDVRNAFNSPFRPFVLVSTSVGQEGLDFHHYAHAIVHWNLPGNPVDLEQREGRVHRYKGHAVRKNVSAEVLGAVVIDFDDPWTRLFDLADRGDGDMRPWWVYPGTAAIERFVPMLPMSRDVARLEELVTATALYRMTLGQPRQAELLAVLAELPEDEQEAVRQAVLVNLEPDP